MSFNRNERPRLYCDGFCCHPGLLRELKLDIRLLFQWIVKQHLPLERSWQLFCTGHPYDFNHISPCHWKVVRYVD